MIPYRPTPFGRRKTLLSLALLVWAIAAAMVMGGFRPMILDSLFAWMLLCAARPSKEGRLPRLRESARCQRAVLRALSR